MARMGQLLLGHGAELSPEDIKACTLPPEPVSEPAAEPAADSEPAPAAPNSAASEATAEKPVLVVDPEDIPDDEFSDQPLSSPQR